MKKNGFTIVEVSILFVIFLIVALLVAPLSLDDTLQAKNTSRWRRVQTDFDNIFQSINMQKSGEDYNFNQAFNASLSGDIKAPTKPYKITFMNGTYPNVTYRFSDYNLTQSGFVISYKLYDSPQNGVFGILMYDVNGQVGPNVWGKDVFGMNIYDDRFEPFCKNDPVSVQKQDCAKDGTGLCCSNYYLIGGSFN